MRPPLHALIQSLQEIGKLKGIASLLGWDQETYMPEEGIFFRAEQRALLSKLIHKKHTSPWFEKRLAKCVNLKNGTIVSRPVSKLERRLLEETYRDWKIVKSLPASFVEAQAKLSSESQHAWQRAKKENAFLDFLPYLKKQIEMARKKADYLGWQESPYNALLDEYEPGITVAALTPLFKRLRDEIMAILRSVQGMKSSSFPSFNHYEETKQWEFGVAVLNDMGFDWKRGRQDRSVHPFTIHFHPTDVRITTRFKANTVMEGITGTIHEAGHALYEQGLDPVWFGTPLGESMSMGIHESQSRLWENHVGKSRAFWSHYFSRLKKLFPEAFSKVSLDHFYKHINAIKPGPIRVEADEVTYNLHILIRFELEAALFEGALIPKDLPEAWREKYQNYLGITPKKDSEGVLQDIHWSMGAFGYFPSYTLGNLYAAQLFERMNQDIAVDALIEKGELWKIKEWLNEHVHRLGRSQRPAEFIKDLTGKSISETPFLRYIRKKVAPLYPTKGFPS